MQRTETPDGQFVAGNPLTGQKGSSVSRAWLTALQEELCSVIEGAGIELDPTKFNQLAAAIAMMATGAVFTDIGGSGATCRLAMRAIKSVDGTISWDFEPVTISRGNL